MEKKALVTFRLVVTIFLYVLLFSEYFLIYPLNNEISPIIPLITVLCIIVSAAILIGIESLILDHETMKKALLISYVYQFLTVLFLIIMLLPETAYSYCSETMLISILCVFTLCHFVLLQLQNKYTKLNNLNLFKKSMDMTIKHSDVSGMQFYKYADALLKINVLFIFVFSLCPLFFRRCLTLLYTVFIIGFYYKIKCNSEFSNYFSKQKIFYELCYQLLVLTIIFIFSKYLSGLMAVIILSLITLPIRNNISKLLKE